MVIPFFTIHFSLFTVFSWNAGWRTLLNQMSEDEQKEFELVHLKEIDELIGCDGVWFNTEVLIAIGNK